MSITYSITKLLNMEDDNLHFNENFLEERKIKNKRCLVIKGKLTNELEGLRGEIKLLGVTELASSGVSYRIIVDTEPMKHNEIQRIILKEIKNELDKKNISIPYTQVVIHNA